MEQLFKSGNRRPNVKVGTSFVKIPRSESETSAKGSKISNVTCSDADDERQFDLLRDTSPGNDHLPMLSDSILGAVDNIKYSFQEPVCVEDDDHWPVDAMDDLLATTGKNASSPSLSAVSRERCFPPSNHTVPNEITQHNYVSMRWSHGHVERSLHPFLGDDRLTIQSGPQKLTVQSLDSSPPLNSKTHDQVKRWMDDAQIEVDFDMELDRHHSDSDILRDFDPIVPSVYARNPFVKQQPEDLFDTDTDDTTLSMDDQLSSLPLFEEHDSEGSDLFMPEPDASKGLEVDYGDSLFTICDEFV